MGSRRGVRPRTWVIGLLPVVAAALAVSIWFSRSRGLQTPVFHLASSGELSHSPAAERLRAGAAGANLIIILLDAARADHFTSFGYTRDTTPNLARFFDDSVLFTEAYPAGASTRPSVASLFTSQFPDTHGALARDWPMPREGATLAECMSAAGYATVAFSASPTVSLAFGYGRGFASFREVFRDAGLPAAGLPHHRVGAVDGALVLEATRKWLRAHRDERFFAYLHFLEPHFPYGAPGDFRAAFARPGPKNYGRSEVAYDWGLAYVDSLIAQLLKELDALGLLDRSVVVAMSDHGEGFGEHGFRGHGNAVYGEIVHVPLAFHLPTRCEARPRRMSEVFCLTDVMPTLLDLLGIPPPKTMQGRSRLGLLAGEHEERPGFAVTRAAGTDMSGGVSDAGQVSYALRVPRYTLILADRGRRVELYDRQADPSEQHDIAGQRPALAQQLHRQFEAWASAQRGRPVVLPGGRVFAYRGRKAAIDEETRRQLKALGYLK
jgi:arylsulfatase A-like enzyme